MKTLLTFLANNFIIYKQAIGFHSNNVIGRKYFIGPKKVSSELFSIKATKVGV